MLHTRTSASGTKRSLEANIPVDEARRLKEDLFGGGNAPPSKRRRKAAKTDEEQPEAAWIDPEDEKLSINLRKNRKLRKLRTTFDEETLNGAEFIQRQRQQFKSIYGNDEDWSKLTTTTDETETHSSDDENETKSTENRTTDATQAMFASSARITVADKDVLPDNNIAYTDLGYINGKSPHKSVITALEFHPNGQLLLMAGLDKTLQLYQMNGAKNNLLKKIFISDLPIRQCKFTADGKEVIITGRRYYFYIFDLESFEIRRIDKMLGRDERSWEQFWVSPNNTHILFLGSRGDIIVVSRVTMRPVKTLHISDGISNITFNRNGWRMSVLSISGQLYTFDMNTYRCINSVACEGIVKATAFHTFAPLSLFAIGCNSGVVSVFQNATNAAVNKDTLESQLLKDHDVSTSRNGQLNALYSVDNLTTGITGVEFNFDGQLCVIHSKNKKQSLRLIHTATGRVYQNWPKDKGLGYVYRCTFSPHSGYLAVGNDAGYVKLIRLHFYGQL